MTLQLTKSIDFRQIYLCDFHLQLPLLLEGWCGWADDLWLWGGGGGVSDDGHGALQQGRQLLVLQLLIRHVLRQSIIHMLKHLGN